MSLTVIVRDPEMIPEATESSARARGHEFILLIAAWLVLATMMALLARQNLSVPGLYYDEAIFAGMAKDFVTGQVHGQHMPDHEVVTFLGRPFPVFVQAYLGALKSWMLIPSFSFLAQPLPCCDRPRLSGQRSRFFFSCSAHGAGSVWRRR